MEAYLFIIIRSGWSLTRIFMMERLKTVINENWRLLLYFIAGFNVNDHFYSCTCNSFSYVHCIYKTLASVMIKSWFSSSDPCWAAAVIDKGLGGGYYICN